MINDKLEDPKHQKNIFWRRENVNVYENKGSLDKSWLGACYDKNTTDYNEELFKKYCSIHWVKQLVTLGILAIGISWVTVLVTHWQCHCSSNRFWQCFYVAGTDCWPLITEYWASVISSTETGQLSSSQTPRTLNSLLREWRN